MRLIDADELIKEVNGNPFTTDSVKSYVKISVQKMPTVQPEIIRCKDCKHRHEAECPMYHEEDIEWDDDGYTEYDMVIHDWTKDDGYCDRGERRTDETDRCG